MRKTLFSKHFITVAAIILLSITILGAVLLAFASANILRRSGTRSWSTTPARRPN